MSTQWETVIGLEVHAQLKTNTKLFCSCPNEFGGEPNTRTCPVCIGMPGALPVINNHAVSLAVQAGLAMGCRINTASLFSRKSYFYYDLPNGYQTSQWEPPICEEGMVEITADRGPTPIRINRIHLENDAGKCLHEGANTNFIDLNRAGTPLIEIVSEPDLRSAEEAAEFMRHLRRMLMYLGITDGNMEEGSMRCDVNISLRPKGSKEYGIRSELKNLNSFNSILDATRYEIERHTDVLNSGGVIDQETRHYDPDTGTTSSMRSKEDAPDYRYFPCPDLPPVLVSAEFIEDVRKNMPELPEARQKRFEESLGLNSEESAILVGSAELAGYFEAALALHNNAKRIATLILGDLLPECSRRGIEWQNAGFGPERLAYTAKMVDEGKVSLKVVHDIFAELLTGTDSVEKLAEKKGLLQVSDSGALEEAVLKAIADNPTETEAYRGGKTKLLSFFVGQVMRATKGAGNPGVINELLKKHLEG
ncbi:Asp-tRNA(Asn)/Glu-tRNA(Gln) amidotransferase subunit GatB [Desulfovibrio sp. OttesenSCG-928-F07]|nr:Asp-tRNA(Asn)/Glu-tRNA(Gln) amidotransferase subunit GatB [Desulfovibrio sp. OttesenSCG-928-F07]